MERTHHPMTTFFSPDPLEAGTTITLGEDVAHHARVKRLTPGERVRLSDGHGTTADGAIARIGRTTVAVSVESVASHDPPRPMHLLVPIADRERMLWLAEKATEIGLASWRPVMYKRSRSVTPRGEGTGFQAKTRARAVAALEQSGAPWLPVFYPDAPLDRAIAAAPAGARILLDRSGPSIASAAVSEPLTIALGPEGGLEDFERDQLIAAGFMPKSLGANVLRFETAAVAAMAVAHALLMQTSPIST